MSTSNAGLPTILLSWHGPFTLRAGAPNSVWIGPLSARSGIYLWTVPVSGRFLIHWVGATGQPFWRRQHEHVEAFARGEYPIHRAMSLAAGRRDPIHRGLFGDPRQWAVRQQQFRNRKPKLEPELQRTLSLLAVFLAPLDAEPRVRQRIQTAIVNRVRRAGSLAAAVLETRGAPGDRLPAELPVRVTSRSRAWVLGVDGEFEA